MNNSSTRSKVCPNSPKAWLLAARPKTISGACVPVLVATALAWSDGKSEWIAALLCFIFAALMQVAANFINDLYDFLKGTDGFDRLGPERACAQGWISPRAMRWGIAVVISLACGVGLSLLFGHVGAFHVEGAIWWNRVWAMVFMGAACVLFAFLYTTVLSYWGMGDVLVLVFFGFVPVCGTYFVQAGTLSWEVWLCGLTVGLVIDLLLVINNFRDRDTDRACGKRTLIALLGERFGSLQYLCVGVSAVLLGFVWIWQARPWAALLPLGFLLLHWDTWREMMKICRGRALNQILAKTSRNMLIYGLLLSLGFVLSAWR